MKRWIYQWLPIIFGCHCKEERSFHYRGQRFPICARCTGELLGIFVAVITFGWGHPELPWLMVLLLPMVLDGGVQLLTAYESGNIRRLVTGGLFGFALAEIFFLSTVSAFQMGMDLGAGMK